jgi:menaquinone-dependent protoporphyrinogen oxidase
VKLLDFNHIVENRPDAQSEIKPFMQKTGWHPQNVASFAGALAYSKYGFLKRFVMQRVARGVGEPTDPTRDYEYTDWEAVTRFAETFVAALSSVQELGASGV